MAFSLMIHKHMRIHDVFSQLAANTYIVQQICHLKITFTLQHLKCWMHPTLCFSSRSYRWPWLQSAMWYLEYRCNNVYSVSFYSLAGICFEFTLRKKPKTARQSPVLWTFLYLSCSSQWIFQGSCFLISPLGRS